MGWQLDQQRHVGDSPLSAGNRLPPRGSSQRNNLIDTEQRIALARGYFNEIAPNFNTRLEIIPESFVARLAGMKPQSLMAANDFERAAVKVTL